MRCQAIIPGAAVNALQTSERHPWVPGCGGEGLRETSSQGRLAGLPGDAKLLVAQVGRHLGITLLIVSSCCFSHAVDHTTKFPYEHKNFTSMVFLMFDSKELWQQQ